MTRLAGLVEVGHTHKQVLGSMHKYGKIDCRSVSVSGNYSFKLFLLCPINSDLLCPILIPGGPNLLITLRHTRGTLVVRHTEMK